MNYFCNNSETIIALLTSGILGAAGQALRVGISLFELKLARNPMVEADDLSTPGQKLWGLFVGFFVGVMLTPVNNLMTLSFTTEQAIAIVAAGYAVSDMLEQLTSMVAQREMSVDSGCEMDADKQPFIVGQKLKNTIKS